MGATVVDGCGACWKAAHHAVLGFHDVCRLQCASELGAIDQAVYELLHVCRYWTRSLARGQVVESCLNYAVVCAVMLEYCCALPPCWPGRRYRPGLVGAVSRNVLH